MATEPGPANAAGTIERREEIFKDARSVVTYWLNAIRVSEKQEENWQKKADKAVKLYRGDTEVAFNILHSNVETIVPALYNSTPVPDVRTQHQDKNEVARRGAQLIERALTVQLNEYDFDAEVVAAVRDMQIAGRGVTRVGYRPYERTDPELGTSVVWEEAFCEHVSWRSVRRGPGSKWSEIPWWAFEKFLTRDELVELAGEEIGSEVALDAQDGTPGDDATERERSAFKKGRVWEIWDKPSRTVFFIAPSFDKGPLKALPDPLGLLGFFNIPKPLQAISDPDTMVPVVPYEIYRRQADELADVSGRILALVRQIRYRGIRASEIPELDGLEELEDGQFSPSEGAMSVLGGGRALDDAIWVVPIDKLVQAVRELLLQRDQIKQAIYEITGIADILRGASRPSETATAQSIKAQWGSLRLQHQQKEVERYCRDIFRMKAEIIANKFSPDTLMLVAGEEMAPPPQAQPQLPPPQPGMPADPAQMMQAMAQGGGGPPGPDPEVQRAEIAALLRNDIRRTYLIDIETDSTIRGDMARSQENYTRFIQGSAQFFQTFVPLIQSGAMPPEVAKAAVAVYGGFARQFKLGKHVDDALAELEQAAAQMPPGGKPKSPEEEEAKQISKATAVANLENRQASTQKTQAEAQKAAAGATAQQVETALVAQGVPAGPGFVQ